MGLLEFEAVLEDDEHLTSDELTGVLNVPDTNDSNRAPEAKKAEEPSLDDLYNLCNT